MGLIFLFSLSTILYIRGTQPCGNWIQKPFLHMDLNNLSSNWKKLQETLKKDTSKPPKRKASQDVPQLYDNGIKRRKRTIGSSASIPHSKKSPLNAQSMGVVLSKAKETIIGPSSSSLALWAKDNDISPQDLAAAYGTPSKKASPLDLPLDTEKNTDNINEGLSSAVDAGRYISIDCEMVGVGPTPDTSSALARVSLVDYHGHQVYDSFVLPKETITDYRTFVSGITPQLLKSARTLENVQKDVAQLLDGRILVGHAIRNDLDALLLGHPKRDIRDTSKYPPFRELARGKTPSLKRLAHDLLGIDIQSGEHSSIEDARATMLLFRMEKEGFDKEHLKHWGKHLVNKPMGTDLTTPNKKKKKKKKKKQKKKAGELHA